MSAPIFSSPKTSLAAVGIIVAMLGYVAFEIANENMAGIEWSVVITALVTALGFFFARDSDKSSEDVGIK